MYTNHKINKMKPIIQKLWMFIAVLCASLSVSAQDFFTTEMWYRILSEGNRTVEIVQAVLLSGDIEIPRKVIYESKTYTVTSIGKDAFSTCGSLTSVTIPNSVTFIGDNAFSCSRLENINVDSENVNYSSIDGILYNKEATNLIRCPKAKTSATIPNSVTTISEKAFSGCDLTSVTIPNSVISIGDNAFQRCSNLTSVTIPNSVTSIGAGAFYYCGSLTSVTIPNTVTSIGKEAFYHCESLISVTIPNSVTSIGDNAFQECSSLTSVTIPNSVTSIGASAFYGCSSLTSVTIPNSVTSIGYNAFYYCVSLKAIYMQCEVPIECDPRFSDDALKEAVLYVPTGTMAEYEKVDPWRNFWNIEEMDFTGVDGIEADNNDSIQISVNNGILTIDGIGRHESVTVYDMHGCILYNGLSHSIDKLSPGIYIVKAGSSTIKISI